jgi:hypothetical protein
MGILSALMILAAVQSIRVVATPTPPDPYRYTYVNGVQQRERDTAVRRNRTMADASGASQLRSSLCPRTRVRISAARGVCEQSRSLVCDVAQITHLERFQTRSLNYGAAD